MSSFFIKDEKTTLKDYLFYWFVSIFSQRIEDTTKYLSAYVLYKFLFPNIEDKIVLRYVNSDYLDQLLEKASKYCDSAGNKSRELLYIAFNDAIKERLINDNPVIGARKYSRNSKRIRIPDKKEIKDLLIVAKERAWFLEIILALYCGLRKGEILGLKFQDFDIQKGVMYVQRQLVVEMDMEIEESDFKVSNFGRTFRDPKKNSKRALKVPPIIFVELEKRRRTIQGLKEKYAEKFVDQDLISCQKNGNPRGLASLNNELIYISEKINKPKVTPHGLRHTYAIILAERKVSLAKISALLGHSSIHTTFQWYLDVMEENEKIKEFFNTEFVTEEMEAFYGFDNH